MATRFMDEYLLYKLYRKRSINRKVALSLATIFLCNESIYAFELIHEYKYATRINGVNTKWKEEQEFLTYSKNGKSIASKDIQVDYYCNDQFIDYINLEDKSGIFSINFRVLKGKKMFTLYLPVEKAKDIILSDGYIVKDEGENIVSFNVEPEIEVSLTFKGVNISQEMMTPIVDAHYVKI